MIDKRFDRNVRLFGEEGQRRLRRTNCTLVGIGGLGTIVAQQLALLGVRGIALVDYEELDETNRNRYVGVRHTDPVPGTLKVDIGRRLVQEIDSDIIVLTVAGPLRSEAGFAAVREADWVFGCLDSEGARLVLTELCAAYDKPYIDMASDVITTRGLEYGGRVCVARSGDGCLACLDQLDLEEAGRELEGPRAREDRDAIYGVDRDALGRSGPSVVSINGVVASLAVSEFMVAVTGLRPPKRLLTYRGSSGKVTTFLDEPRPGCWYCSRVRGSGVAANVERYLK